MSAMSGLTPQDRLNSVLGEMRAHALFRRMMSRQGVDITGSWWPGSGQMMFSALRQCSACKRPKSCREWLDEEYHRQKYPSFCPNATMSDRLVLVVNAHKGNARR